MRRSDRRHRTRRRIATALLTLGLAFSGSAAQADSPYEDVVITEPGGSGRVDTSAPRFAGTGQAGAYVVVKDLKETVLCATRVRADGWSCESVVEMGDGPTGVVVTQTAWGVTSTAKLRFDVAKAVHLDLRSWIPSAVGVGIAAILLLALAALLLYRARHRVAPSVVRAGPPGPPAGLS